MIRPWLLLTRKIKLVLLPLVSAVLTAVYVEMDKLLLTYFIPDVFAFTFISLWLGTASLIGLIVIMRIPLKRGEYLGEYIDPNFQRLILPKGGLLYWIIIAGLSASISTFTYFQIISISNPALILPFSKLMIVYLIILESMSDRDIPTIIEVQSIILILTGVFLMAAGDIAFNPITIGIVLGPYNISGVVFTVAVRNAKRRIYMGKRVDSLNIRLWVLTLNSVFTSVFFAPFIFTPSGLSYITSLTPLIILLIILDMMAATFASITYIRALAVAKMSIVNAILAFTVILGIPFTLIGNMLIPGGFGTVNLTGIYGMLTLTGAFMIAIGIFTIATTQVKGYLLIYLDKSAATIFQTLRKVKGITRISAVSGENMLIAELKIRSLGKAYRTIVTELEKIDGIKKVRTLTSIKEWEKI
ncbi:MAG: Lrp/AsnC ligand binding domain-containing protein [Candidatus Odinarchaeum yellowstonii]|uniref:Lrp/AsnC ligand binding domain-containing protein n=1 Tax=Odinarchaeota yellowstonii (strain LCB_4) TaxID=1841599 RepID=A0AAF0D365_ODILC|nr:MAG: Lrp/AsnC ligand binding domain-containing protein [Candidatus Odinarchaeum yellowstonii]